MTGVSFLFSMGSKAPTLWEPTSRGPKPSPKTAFSSSDRYISPTTNTVEARADRTAGSPTWDESSFRVMNREGLLLDLAHASPATFGEALALTSFPPVVSHIGARAVHDTPRNLSDDQIRAVAERGGIIGVMLAPPATTRPDLHEVIAHLRHIIAVGGEDTAALGSDYDGYVQTPIDVGGLPQLTQLMLDEGWSEKRIRKVFGENFLRVLDERDRAADFPRP